MKKNTQSTIEKLMKNFIPSDFDDLIALAKKEKADCIKKLDDEKKKKAAEILLNNMDVLFCVCIIWDVNISGWIFYPVGDRKVAFDI